MAKKRAEEYYLMHKDIPVCLMELSPDGSLGSYRKNTSALEHFPIGGRMNDMKFHDWWRVNYPIRWGIFLYNAIKL